MPNPEELIQRQSQEYDHRVGRIIYSSRIALPAEPDLPVAEPDVWPLRDPSQNATVVGSNETATYWPEMCPTCYHSRSRCQCPAAEPEVPTRGRCENPSVCLLCGLVHARPSRPQDYDNGGSDPSCAVLIRQARFKVESLYPAIPPFPYGGDSLLRLGVELEVEAKADTYDGVRAVLAHDNAKDWIICKQDGSLDDGFEVVTAPSILEEHTKRWPDLLKTLRVHTESWRRTTTGLHVHLSRAFFTQLEIAKFVVFMNSEATRPYVVSLAGRSSPQYAALEKKELNEINVNGSDRYEAVNLANKTTIEVRLFKGTLHTQHVLADIEFCDALARWVQVNTLEQCENWHDFMFYVKEQNLYPNLVSYMAEREEKVQAMLVKQFAKYTEECAVELTSDLTNEGGD